MEEGERKQEEQSKRSREKYIKRGKMIRRGIEANRRNFKESE